MASSEIEVIDLECDEQRNSDYVKEVVSVDSGEEMGKPEGDDKLQEEVEVISRSSSPDCKVVFSNVKPKSNQDVVSDQKDAQARTVEEDPEGSDNFFVIDRVGGSDPTEKPLYINECVGVLGEEAPATPAQHVLPSMACFNCGGDHHVSECTREIDRARVAKNRREAAKYSVGKSPRYHQGEEQMKRFQPGCISDEMRRALDIGLWELPPFIYRMRVLGYPPGWLMEATVESSGLKIYGRDGKAIEDESIEDGEICSAGSRVQYDPSKLVSFPGFNVPTPPGVYDQYEKYDMPPMQPHQQRSEAEKYMKAPATPCTRRRKLTCSAPRKKEETVAEVDMDLDSDGDINLNGNADFSAAEPGAVCVLSPSDPKREDSTGFSHPSWSSHPSCSFHSASTVLQESVESQPSTSSAIQGKYEEGEAVLRVETMKDNASKETLKTPSSKSSGGRVFLSQAVSLGTPVITGFSKYNRLPPRENFAKGISEHIPFENLPGATGTYDKLRGVLAKVRKSLSDERSKFDSAGTSGS